MSKIRYYLIEDNKCFDDFKIKFNNDKFEKDDKNPEIIILILNSPCKCHKEYLTYYDKIKTFSTAKNLFIIGTGYTKHHMTSLNQLYDLRNMMNSELELEIKKEIIFVGDNIDFKYEMSIDDFVNHVIGKIKKNDDRKEDNEQTADIKEENKQNKQNNSLLSKILWGGGQLWNGAKKLWNGEKGNIQKEKLINLLID
jgi:hypothetical protein